MAVGAWDIHIRKELDVKADAARSVTGGTAELTCIVGEVAGLPAPRLRSFGSGEDLAEFVMYVGVSGHGGPYVDSDGSGIDQLDLPDARSLDAKYMGRHLLAVYHGSQSRNQAFEDHGRLAGS